MKSKIQNIQNFYFWHFYHIDSGVGVSARAYFSG